MKEMESVCRSASLATSSAHTQTHTERQTQCALGVLCMRREAVYDGTFHAAKAAVN